MTKRFESIINADEISRNGRVYPKEVLLKAMQLPPVTATSWIPENFTNGDVIKTIFRPYIVREGISYFHVYLTEEDDFNVNRWGSFEKDWWNAPYKKEGDGK